MGDSPDGVGVPLWFPALWFPALWDVRTWRSRMEGEDTTHNRDLVLQQGEDLRLFMYFVLKFS